MQRKNGKEKRSTRNKYKSRRIEEIKNEENKQENE